ncbi:MAG: hypothetical protein AB8F74_09785 [Saprospiraceae bacterium]
MENDDILDVDFTSDSDRIEIELIESNKFILLYFLSMGLYGPWWMYKAWNFFKTKDNLDIVPAGRALFALFFLYQLMEKIKNYATANGYGKSYSSGLLFLGFVILSIAARLPDPYWLCSLAAFVFLLPAHGALNYGISNSEVYAGVFQSGFNSRQLVIVVLGVIFWGLVLLGFLIPVE